LRIESDFGKYLNLSNLHFAYGHDVIVAAILDCYLRPDLSLAKDPSYKNYGRDITFRLKKDSRGWRIFVSTDIQLPLGKKMAL